MAVRPEPLRDLDWPPDRAAALGQRAVEMWREFLETLSARPVAHRLSDNEVRDLVTLDIPDQPMGDDELLEHVRSVIEHSMYPGHPRFMAYISGTGTVPGVAADFLAAALNQNLGGWRLSPAASEIELHLTRWFARLFGLPETGGGLLVSGGAMANFVPLKTARDRKAGWDIRNEGVSGGPPLVLYASEEVHAVVDRAADMLGLGMQALRKIPVDGDYLMRMDVLEQRVQEDLEAGRRPFCVVGTAGTVATGAVDPLEQIADLCERHDLWFHADAAYGGPAVLAEDLRPLFAGIERADSIAFDPHKWLYTPHSGGCAVFRDLQHLADSFAVQPTYVHEDKERTGHGLDFGMLGPQFSRGFQAFKVWLSLLAHGTAAYGRRISHDAALARYMGELVEERPDFELTVPVGLSICCFRYRPPDLPPSAALDEYLSLLNERLMTEIQLDGRAFCSNAVLDGRFVLRACIVNFRTEAEDVEATIEVAAELGERLDKELRPATLRSRT